MDNIYEMSTQAVLPPTSTEKAKGSIFSEETQQVELGEESLVAEKKAKNDKSLFDMETEPILPQAKTTDPIFEQQTQALCADNGRGESPKGNGDLRDPRDPQAQEPIVEPEIVAKKVNLCGEDEDTLPNRFGDRTGEKGPEESLGKDEGAFFENANDDDEEETQIIEDQGKTENDSTTRLEVSGSFAECALPNAQSPATPKTHNDTQPFKPSDDGEEKVAEEEEEEDLFSSQPDGGPTSSADVETKSDEKKDAEFDNGDSDGSEDLLAATPSSDRLSPTPLGRVSSSTPLKSSQGSNLDHSNLATTLPSLATTTNNTRDSVSTDEDIEDTKILTSMSEDSTVLTDGDIEDTKIIAGSSVEEKTTEEEASNAEENNSKAELTNGDESDDEVIPSSQDSGALSGRTNLLTQ